MTLSEIKTNAELSSYIECYWKSNSILGEELTIFPDGTFNVIISSHDFYIGKLKKRYVKGSYLIPITLNPIRIKTIGSVYGIRFKAFSLQNIVGNKPKFLGSINELTGTSRTCGNLEGIINNQRNLEFISDSMSEFSFELLNKNYALNSSLRDKVNYILDRKGNIKVSELCSDFGISRQALHKFFKVHLGISPKELATTWRLNHFFTLINDTDSLTESALDAGYFDQAHSINSFKSKWESSPNSFKKNQNDLLQIAKTNMKNRFNNYYDPIIIS